MKMNFTIENPNEFGFVTLKIKDPGNVLFSDLPYVVHKSKEEKECIENLCKDLSHFFTDYDNHQGLIVHFKLLLNGKDLIPESDPFTPISLFRHYQSQLFVRGIQHAYNERRAPFKKAFLESPELKKLKETSVNIFSSESWTPELIELAGYHLPKHDEIWLIVSNK